MPASTRPRLLQLVTLSDWGGAQACVFALARGLRATFDVTVGCAPGGPLIDRLRAEGIRVVEIPTLRRLPAPAADLAALMILVGLMRRERFAVVHCHSTKAGLLGRLAGRLARVPVIVFTVHGWPFAQGESAIVRIAATWAERLAARAASAVVCVAEHARDEARRMRIARPGQLHVIYNGIDPSRWRVDRPAPEAGAEARPCTVVTVHRLAGQKDPFTLLEAWRRIDPRHRLEMIGDGPLRPQVEARIARHALGGRVTLLGARPDIEARLRRADIFTLSSRWEGLPFVIIEAMMSGLPVVASRVGGVAELVDHGVTGLLVPPGDPEELAAALEGLLRDPLRRHAMGEAGQRRAFERFTEAEMVDRTAGLYARLLRARGPGIPA
jgi:glycosyltransferase involved in cell wall biosynthesis